MTSIMASLRLFDSINKVFSTHYKVLCFHLVQVFLSQLYMAQIVKLGRFLYQDHSRMSVYYMYNAKQ